MDQKTILVGVQDTPHRIQDYVNHFNKDFIGLTVSVSALAKVWNDNGIYRAIPEGSPAIGYTVDHMARLMLIDRDGNLRASYGYGTLVEDLVHDLKLLSQEF